MKILLRLAACVISGLALVLGCAANPQPESPQSPPPGSASTEPGRLTTRRPGEFKQPGQNPFTGAGWYVDPYSSAAGKANALRKERPADAALIDKIAKYGGADWIGSWTAYVGDWVRRRTTAIEKEGALPLYIVYNIPGRDCGQYSAGGLKNAEEYQKWILDMARGIGDRKAVVVLEPDALGLLKQCLTEPAQQERLALLKFAVQTFNQLPWTYVYLDGGHSAWLPAEEAAARLKAAGVEEAQGFALNTSNYRATEELIEYGKKVSALLGGKHFVIDTSRNGNGPPTVTDPKSEESWCNPPGRALGSPPTSETADPSCDAYLWLKKPGESDGTCNGGPKAGEWYAERALELARNARF
jgi:endoglucanase